MGLTKRVLRAERYGNVGRGRLCERGPGREEMGRENLALTEHLCHDIHVTYTARRMDHRTS